MDVSSYYYYYYYNPNTLYNTQVPSYEAYQTVNDGQLEAYISQTGAFSGQVGAYDGQIGANNGEISLNNGQLNTNEEEDDTFKDPDAIPLPKELTDMFKPLECELCGVQVLSEASAFTHYEGKTHIKFVNAYMKEHYNVYGSLSLKKERFVPIKCDVCNIELTSKVVYQQHFSGKQHQKNLRKIQYSNPLPPVEDIFNGGDSDPLKGLPPPPLPPVLSDFVCAICNITTNTEQQLNLHKNGQKHKRKLNKLKESKLDNALNAFYNGEWPEGSENGVFTTDISAENGTIETTPSFIENPAMDYPLLFNSSYTEPSCDNTSVINNETGAVNSDSFTAPTTTIAENIFLPSSLEEKASEIPIDLGVNDGKLLCSTGIFLRQLSVVSQQITNTLSESGNAVNSTETVATTEKNNAEVSNSIDVEPVQLVNSSSDKVEPSENKLSNNPTSDNQSDILKNARDPINKTDSISHNIKNMENHAKQINSSVDSETNEQKNENLPSQNSKGDDDNTRKIDSQLDQVITKLAIEEIEKEGTNFEKIRSFIPTVVSTKEVDQLNSTNKYKYDKAGYRINEVVGKSKDRKNNDKENDDEANEKRNLKNSSNYNYNSRRYGNRNYNNSYGYNGYGQYGYNNWRNNDNYGMYNKYNHSNWNRNYEKNCDYKSSRDREKRKRNRRYSSDEEHSRSHKSRRSSYKDHYKDRKNRSRSRSRKRRSSSRNRKRKSRSGSRKRRSTSRTRKYRSSSSEQSRKSDNSDRELSKKDQSKKKSGKRADDEKTNVKENKRDRRRRSDSSSSDNDDSISSSSSRHSKKSSECHYTLDKDGWCDRKHRCQKSYDKCPNKHKEPFKIKIEKMEPTEEAFELSKNSWNPEAPYNNEVTSTITDVKVEKTEEENVTKIMIDPALSAYMTTAGTYFCKYCIVSTKSNELFREHLQTPKHALLMKFKHKINHK